MSLLPTRRAAWLPLLAGAAALLAGGWCSPPAFAEPAAERGKRAFKTQKDLLYATVGGTELRLDLFTPRGVDGPAPCVVWIHGGAWRFGDKSWNRLRWLASQGFAIAAIDYRLTGVAPFPAQIHDCKGAVRWLRANGERLGVRTDRLAAAGSSAGAHLATLLGTSAEVAELEGETGGNLDRSSRVQAVVDYYGPSDFLSVKEHAPPSMVEYHNSRRSPLYHLIGGPVTERTEQARLASPARHVSKDDAPLLIFHGERDPLVPHQQSELLAKYYRGAGLDVSLNIVPGVGHGWRRTEAEQAQVVEFLNRWIGP